MTNGKREVKVKVNAFYYMQPNGWIVQHETVGLVQNSWKV